MKKSFIHLLWIGTSFLLLFNCSNQESTASMAEDTEVVKRDTIMELTGKMADTIIAQLYLDSAVVLIDAAKYKEALIFYQQALDVYRETVGEIDSLTAKAYIVGSNIYWRQNQLDKAIEVAEVASEIAKIELGKNNLILANSYFQMANVWSKQGALEKAISYFGKSLKIRILKLGEDHVSLVAVHVNLGVAYRTLGNYEMALANYQKGLDILIRNRGKFHPGVAIIYNNIGNIWYFEGNYDRAIFNLNEALEIRREVRDDNHPEVADTYGNIGGLYLMKGDYDQALINYEDALRIRLNSLGQEDPDVGSTYNNMGAVFDAKGDHNTALIYYKKALAIKEKTLSENHPDLAVMQANVGTVLDFLGDTQKALIYLQNAINIFENAQRTQHPYIIGLYNNIGVIWKKKGNFDLAMANYEKALSLGKQIHGNSHPILATVSSGIGDLWLREGTYDNALKKFQEALNIDLIVFGDSHPQVAYDYNKLGIVWCEKGELEKGKQYFLRAYQILGYDFEQPDIFSTVNDPVDLQDVFRSFEYYYTKNFKQTQDPSYLDSLRNHYQIMISLERSIRNEYFDSATRQLYTEQSIPIYEGAIANLLERNITEEISEAFHLAEDTKSRQLAAKLQLEPYTVDFGIPDSLREKEHTLNVDIAFYEKKVFEEEYEVETSNDSLLRIYQNRIFDLRNKRDSLLAFFQSEFPHYYNLRYNQQVINIKGVQDSLLVGDNQALVEYFVGDSSIYAFTILPDTFFIHDFTIDFPLEQWVQAMRCGIFSEYSNDPTDCGELGSNGAQAQYVSAAYGLYNKIFAPIDDLLPNNCNVTIVPDGILGYLPFDAMLTKVPNSDQLMANYDYLLRDHPLSYAHSATLQKEMKYKRHNRNPRKNLLAIAPLFDEAMEAASDTRLLANRFIDTSLQRNRLSPLTYNIPEAESIVEMIGGKSLIGAAATEEAFIQEAGDYRLLHLSTHGKANDELGDYSFLAFQYLEDSLENEWLYNRELYNLNLNADMVVLSACETGIGELQRGEGIISLARGFSYAGAKSIITSLWSVNDQSTKVLMELFYQNLKDGMPKDKALQRAKINYIENHPNLGQSPFYWAAFIPIGDMSPVVLSTRWRSIWWLVAGAFLISGLLYWWSIRKKRA